MMVRSFCDLGQVVEVGNPEHEGRTEKPTEKRLKEARQEGRIAKSQDLAAWFSLLAATAFIEKTFTRGASMLKQEMHRMEQVIGKPDMRESMKFMIESVRDGFVLVLPLALVFAVLAIIGFGAQTRFRMAPKALKPNFKALNPIPGVKRLFSIRSTMQAVKQSVKLIAISVLSYFTIYKTTKSLLSGGPYPFGSIMETTGKAAITFVKYTALLACLIGILDYFFERRQTSNSLKMTKQEVKDETKNQDIPNEVKARLRQKQRQLSRNRMMAAIRDADVVVVNPVHIAMAITYSADKGAPKVVAKGAGFLAERIKERAEENNVPLVQDIPLARALHASCEIDDEIPMELFEAVAKLLAFVFGLKRRGFASGLHKMPGSPDLEDANKKDAERFAATGETDKARARREKTEKARAMRSAKRLTKSAR